MFGSTRSVSLLASQHPLTQIQKSRKSNHCHTSEICACKSFPCHTYENKGLKDLKSFVCHTFSIFCFRVPFRDTLTSFRRYNPPVDPNQHLGRTLMLLGAVLVVAGTLLYFGGRLPFRLGRLPGDIVHRGDHSTLYFPFTTCILLSVALSLIFWLVNHFRR